MANTYTLIEAKTLGSVVASITFSSIPQTYTDLLVKVSARSNSGGNTHDNFLFYFNGTQSNRTNKILYGISNGTGTYSSTDYFGAFNAPVSLANTFGNAEFYIPNYTGSNQKPICGDMVSENNTTNGQNYVGAALWADTAAITSLTIGNYNASDFAINTTAYLYGISKT
jgi:hypothetical protein